MGGKGYGKSISHAGKKQKLCKKWSRNTMLVGTWIKYLSAGLKIGVPASTILKN
jgi:ribosomal protein L28